MVEPPAGGCSRHAVADHDEGRGAVAPRIVHGHRGMLQADGAVAQSGGRFAGDLEIAMAHRDRGFLMHAGDEFRLLVAAVIDDRFMDAAAGGGRVREHEIDLDDFRTSTMKSDPAGVRLRPASLQRGGEAEMAAMSRPVPVRSVVPPDRISWSMF